MARDYSRQEVLEIVQREAQERGIPRDDFLRFAYIETGGRFDEQASRGPNGAKGLFQFIPSTAAQYGIAGRELDAVANTDAAARLYLDNRRDLTAHHGRTGQDYLSGQAQPNGLDMYMAHQQGIAGYHSIQAGIANGSFTRSDTRPHILNNVSPRDIERVTGMTMDEFRNLPDRQMGETFVRYWDTKYRNINIPEVGVQPLGGGQPAQGGQGQSPGGSGQSTNPANAMADGVLQRGEKGPEVKAMQEQLIKAGITQVNGRPFTADSDFGPQTEAAVREYQRSRGLADDGKAGPQTLNALKNNTPAKTEGAPDQTQNGVVWPTPGNHKINEADKPREGKGEFGTARGDHTHGGIDIQGKVGDPIVSIRSGTVVSVKPNNGDAGNTVVVDHGNGVKSVYMHLNTMNVKEGQKVEAGEQIATMGRSGNTPKQGDTHLHIEIRDAAAVTANNPKGRIDPLPYLTGAKELDAPAAGKTELKQGDKGENVESMQRQLNKLGYTDSEGKALGEDGKFGPKTKQAIEQFQRENGLPATGVVDKETTGLLNKGMTRYAAADGELKPGEKGPDVRGFQSTLNDLGFKGADGKPLTVDGQYGANTQAAVSAFQKANGLPETGVADKATLDKAGDALSKKQLDTMLDDIIRNRPGLDRAPADKGGLDGHVHLEPARNTPQINDPKHPDNKLYQQALSNLEQMGSSGGFKSREEMERAAAALAADAKATKPPLTDINHVMPSTDGKTLIAVQGIDPSAGNAKLAYVDRNQAVNQPIEESTKMADSKKPEQAAPAQNEPNRDLVDSPTKGGQKPSMV